MHRDVIEVGADGRARLRRGYSEAYKRRLVALTQAAGASVSRIALQHKLNAKLLFAWRRQLGAPAKAAPRRTRATAARPALLPVRIEPQALEVAVDAAPARSAQPDGRIEVEVGGRCVRVHGTVDLAMLEAVLRMLERGW